MRNSAGAIISTGGCLLLLAVLIWAYILESTQDINIYYGSGLLNPLTAGAFAVGIAITFVTISKNYISPGLGAGIVLSLSVFVFLIVLIWAVTGRVDVFLAPGWAFPAQRWVLVGLSALIVFGAGWYARTHDLLSFNR